MPNWNRFASLVLTLNLVWIATPIVGQEVARPMSQTVDVNGVSLHYREFGKGSPLLLLHHFGWSGKVWDPFVQDFAKRHRIIVLDLRGHGASTGWNTTTFSFRQSAEDVLAFLDFLGTERVKAIGASSGAITLLQMAVRKPERIDAMVLVGATPYFPEQFRTMMREPTCADVSPDDLKKGREFHKWGDPQTKALSVQMCNWKDTYEDLSLTPPLLKRITSRTLIVHGDSDRYFPVSLAFEMHHAIPRSNLWVYPRGGHLPIFAEANRPEFIRIASEFLGGE